MLNLRIWQVGWLQRIWHRLHLFPRLPNHLLFYYVRKNHRIMLKLRIWQVGWLQRIWHRLHLFPRLSDHLLQQFLLSVDGMLQPAPQLFWLRPWQVGFMPMRKHVPFRLLQQFLLSVDGMLFQLFWLCPWQVGFMPL